MPILNNPIPPDRMYTDDGQMIRLKILDIGPWNMRVDANVDIAHGIADHTKIINVTGYVVNDGDSNTTPFSGDANDPLATFGTMSCRLIMSTHLSLYRITGGKFDNILYQSVLINRGKIFITYLV